MNVPRVVGVQMDPAWEDREANCARAGGLLAASPPEAGSLVVLPEMFASGFSMNTAAVAEPDAGPAERWMAEEARRHKVWLVGGLARRDGAGTCANEALVMNPAGERVAVYRKQRPFTAGDEHRHYAAGTQPTLFEWSGLRVALFICYDLRFPELFRAAARSRPELYVVIASWPEKRVQHWVKLLQARAIENQAYVIGVNRVGNDPVHRHTGRSLVADPWGEVIADAGESEGLFGAALDLDGLREYREKLPFLADLR